MRRAVVRAAGSAPGGASDPPPRRREPGKRPPDPPGAGSGRCGGTSARSPWTSGRRCRGGETCPIGSPEPSARAAGSGPGGSIGCAAGTPDRGAAAAGSARRGVREVRGPVPASSHGLPARSAVVRRGNTPGPSVRGPAATLRDRRAPRWRARDSGCAPPVGPWAGRGPRRLADCAVEGGEEFPPCPSGRPEPSVRGAVVVLRDRRAARRRGGDRAVPGRSAGAVPRCRGRRERAQADPAGGAARPAGIAGARQFLPGRSGRPGAFCRVRCPFRAVPRRDGGRCGPPGTVPATERLPAGPAAGQEGPARFPFT